MPAPKHTSPKAVFQHLQAKLQGFRPLSLSGLFQFDRWLTAAEVDAAMATEGPPIALHFEYLHNVSKPDALFYAQGYAASQHKSLMSWFGILPLNGGYLVEVQEGGSGKAYGPALIEAFANRVKEVGHAELPLLSAVILTAGGRGVMVELSPSSAVTWTLPEAETAPVATGLARTSQLTLRRQAEGLQQLRAATTVCAASFVVLALALVFTPGAHKVTLLDNNLSVESPLVALDRPVPPDKRAVAVRYANGEWTIELADRPDETRPTLRENAKPTNDQPKSAGPAEARPVVTAELKETVDANR